MKVRELIAVLESAPCHEREIEVEVELGGIICYPRIVSICADHEYDLMSNANNCVTISTVDSSEYAVTLWRREAVSK